MHVVFLRCDEKFYQVEGEIGGGGGIYIRFAHEHTIKTYFLENIYRFKVTNLMVIVFTQHCF